MLSAEEWAPFVQFYLPSLLAGPLMIALALVVLATGRGSVVSRWLALLLGSWGSSYVLYSYGASFVGSPRWSYNMHLAADAGQNLLVFVYPAFVGAAVATPLARPFQAPRARRVLLAAGLVAASLPFLLPRLFFDGPAAVDPLFGGAYYAPQALDRISNACVVLVALYSLAATLDAWRRAPRATLARERAAAYARAFVVHDAGLVVGFVPYTTDVFGLTLIPEPLGRYAFYMALPVTALAALALLAHAFLRHQLFDLDLRLKWTIRQSTLAAIFVAVFFVASESASTFFGATTGSAYVGIAAAGALVFALAPLQRLADRVSDRAMPQVQPTSAYVQFKKLEVYRAAVESAYEEGGVTARERNVLERLRGKLGIAAEDAAAVERDVRGADRA